ncbi:MAG: hypothetical protein DWQ42_16635 [Planctomycetota bacterium]|mgnify:CR=1 FL=1|nr:MAG: hypothetical protein DWQ42_16635 [Planctomycetota bacterium]REK42490.1 MAG: hypothetical protein DWQ46_12955 [Planctomycetota bacterium]
MGSNRITNIEIDSDKNVIQESTWGKKELAEYKVDLLKLCGFGCTYCSSNGGMHISMQLQTISDAFTEAKGKKFDRYDVGDIVITLKGVLDTLQRQLDDRRRPWGKGKTLAFCQLTDGFSPHLLRTGTTRRALEMLIDRTEFRIRVLTKSAIVGRPEWIRFFSDHADRFVVGLSIGSLNDIWARCVERLTSVPTSRVKALHALQDAGIPTYGMLCPMFPEVLDGDHIERLMEAIRPDLCEHVWAEPFNDRDNWEYVRKCYFEGSTMWNWMTDVYENGRQDLWSDYATALYQRLKSKAASDGWMKKLRYLLYEDGIVASDAAAFEGLDGVLLQSKPRLDGRSRNKAIAALQ